MCASTVIESTPAAFVVVLRFDGWNDLQQLPMEPLDVAGSGVANSIECFQLRSMVVVHDPMVNLVATRVARENAVRCAPICTVRIAETAEIHRAYFVDHPICCVVGVASEDQIGTTALQEIAQIAVADDRVDSLAVIGMGRRVHSEYSRPVWQGESQVGSQTGEVVEVAADVITPRVQENDASTSTSRSRRPGSERTSSTPGNGRSPLITYRSVLPPITSTSGRPSRVRSTPTGSGPSATMSPSTHHRSTRVDARLRSQRPMPSSCRGCLRSVQGPRRHSVMRGRSSRSEQHSA